MLVRGLLCILRSLLRGAVSRAAKRTVIALSARESGKDGLLCLLRSRLRGSLLTR